MSAAHVNVGGAITRWEEAQRSSAVLHHELGQVKDGVARRIIVTINEQIHSGVRESEDRPDSQPSGRAYPLIMATAAWLAKPCGRNPRSPRRARCKPPASPIKTFMAKWVICKPFISKTTR